MIESGPMGRQVSPLLNNITIIAGIAILVGVAWAGYSALVVLVGLALAAALVTKLWSRLCLKGVVCERRLNEHRAFPDDEVTLTLRVVNRKILPLPWVEVQDLVPASLGAAAQATTSVGPVEAHSVTLAHSTPLLWYSAASFTHRLTTLTRGYHPLGPLSVTTGDIFGLHPNSLVQDEIEHLIVYPRIHPLGKLGIPSLSLSGNAKSQLRMFEDPSRLAGVREYEPGDSPRRIHWKASARGRALQVKIFESTTDLKVDMFLAMDTFVESPPEDLELAISTAASLAQHLLEREVQTGLFANTVLADTHHPARIAAGSGTAHLTAILDALAKTTAQVDAPFIDFFDRERGELGFGGTLAFIVGEISPQIELLTADLARVGRNVLGFHLGKHGQKSRPAGVSWYEIHRPGKAH